ncbi:glycosyltransferase [Candidatus Collierbacteria bacterium]|nr:glycosyltransferase [Candidatus Collierbacteria bacterium]
MNKIKVSVVVTGKSDEHGARLLLKDLGKQTVKPDEIIIVRSEDYGNCTRGRGRNIGIKKARNELIAVTDVGCRPRRDWVERLAAKVQKGTRRYKNVQVVAGWYRAVAETEWQKSFVPYLVPTRLNKGQAFLPASRSIAFTKSAWKLVGGYPEEPVSGGEDLKFADNLYRNPEVNIIFEPDALVDWPVPETLSAFIKDIVKHTRGNFEAGYWPHIIRNLSVVARWMVMAMWPWLIPGYLIIAGLNKGQALLRQGLALQALRMIVVRLEADAAVVYGTVIGIIDGWVIKKLRSLVSDG